MGVRSTSPTGQHGALLGGGSAYGRPMYDELPPRIKPLRWEGFAGSGFAFLAVVVVGFVFRLAQEDGAPDWLWGLLAALAIVFFVGGLFLIRWAGRRRRTVRGRQETGAIRPSR